MGLAAFIGSVCAGLTLIPLLTTGGEYTVNRALVTREYFLRHAVPLAAVGAALLLSLAWGCGESGGGRARSYSAAAELQRQTARGVS